jgi:beta-galactosidase/beta-glucuronidase
LRAEDVGPFAQPIVVPFAPESPLSGVGDREFAEGIDYHRVIEVPIEWQDLDVVLHFGGVDFHTDVYVDGAWVGAHSGGSSPFSVDLPAAVRPGSRHDITVVVRDFIHAGDQPGGKQSHYAGSYGCFYTRTTGIWQTVWVEAVHPAGLRDFTIVPDVSDGAFIIVPRFRSLTADTTLRVRASLAGTEIGSVEASAADGKPIIVPVVETRLWWPGEPVLYDLELEVVADGEQVDAISSYAGLREVGVRDGRFYLNDASTYLRLVLDQGFYPDGIWTAPSDEALKRDIELSMAAGFNGARLHQKVFEDRFHYWADRLGYLTWSEWPSWGFDNNSAQRTRHFLNEIREVVTALRNHPSIIAWTPFNETARVTNLHAHHINHVDAYETCRALDPTRPVNDASGYVHHRTDIYTVHTYVPAGDELRAQLQPTTTDDGTFVPFRNYPERDAAYAGQPYVVDEFGGIKWAGAGADDEGDADRRTAWGYGGTPRTEDEFFGRLRGLVDALLGFDHVAGWCYTQLTDVEQEQNGVYYYDRTTKFESEKLRSVFARKPDGYQL